MTISIFFRFRTFSLISSCTHSLTPLATWKRRALKSYCVSWPRGVKRMNMKPVLAIFNFFLTKFAIWTLRLPGGQLQNTYFQPDVLTVSGQDAVLSYLILRLGETVCC